MKRIFGISGILLILFSSVFITPSLGMYVEEDLESLEFRILVVIAGRVNVCSEEKELYGFGIIVYTNRETTYFTNYNIGFKALPFFVTKGLLLSVCIYSPSNF